MMVYERWRKHAQRDIIRGIAFITRYTSTSYTEALNLPLSEINILFEEVSNILKEENKPLKT